MMNEDVEVIKASILAHCEDRDEIVNDRQEIKSRLETHLKKFFNYEEIEYCDMDFNKIRLKWGVHDVFVIPYDIEDVGMEWLISAGMDGVFPIIIVEVYPFGFSESEK